MVCVLYGAHLTYAFARATNKKTGSGAPNRFTSEGRGWRLFFTPNQSVQALHEIGEERIVVSNQPRRGRVLKARRSKIPVESRGQGMARLQTVKHGRSPLLQADYSIGHLILKGAKCWTRKNGRPVVSRSQNRGGPALDITVIARGDSDLPQQGQFHVL
jgi:hypothetical protein